jgi:hypothetical protein
MVSWEYLMIADGDDGKVNRVQWLNQHELKDWKRGPAFMDYANTLGAEGWELVAAAGAGSPRGLIFKRPKP